MDQDQIDRALVSELLALWRRHPPTGTTPDGRLWVRWADLGDDPSYDDWSLVPPDSDWQESIPAGEMGWVQDGGCHYQWCRTSLPDGPHDQRVSDWAKVGD